MLLYTQNRDNKSIHLKNRKMKRTTRTKKLSNDVVFTALQQYFATDIDVKSISITEGVVYMDFEPQKPMMITEALIIRSFYERMLFCKDRPLLEEIIRGLVSKLSYNDQKILRVMCGIDNKVPKDLKEAQIFFAEQKFDIKNICAKKQETLQKALRRISRTLKRGVNEKFIHSWKSFEKTKLELLTIEDFFFLDRSSMKNFAGVKSHWVIHLWNHYVRRYGWKEVE
jgi:hypothetical protein